MSKVTIWQCEDECCDKKPHSKRYWLARSKDFAFYEQVSTFSTALTLTDWYVRSTK